jgi:GNAT superfamily N-acetyltransferase
VLELWRSAGVHAERDARVALAGGEVVGYALLQPPGPSRSTIWVDLWTGGSAAEDATAAALLDALRTRVSARAQQAPLDAAARLRIQVDGECRGVRAALEQQGFGVVRTSLQMVGEIGDRPLPRWPDGVHVRTFRPDDARALHQLVMEVLGDTWEFSAEPFESWLAEIESAGDDQSLWWIAEHEGEPIGALIARVDDVDPELVWVQVLGVRRGWRGKWLALALPFHAVQEFRARGLLRAAAGVDAANPSGIHVILSRLGLEVARTFIIYERQLRGPRPVRRALRRARRAVSGRSRS